MENFVIGKKYRSEYGTGKNLVECYGFSPDGEKVIFKIIECEDDDTDFFVGGLFETPSDKGNGWRLEKEKVTITRYTYIIRNAGELYMDTGTYATKEIAREDALSGYTWGGSTELVAIIPITWSEE